MPKNTQGGNKAKKGKNVNNKDYTTMEPENLESGMDQEQFYAIITKKFGNGRVEILCENENIYTARVRGVLHKKKVFLNIDDVVVVSINKDINEKSCDVLGRCSDDRKQHILEMFFKFKTRNNKSDINFEIINETKEEEIVFSEI